MKGGYTPIPIRFRESLGPQKTNSELVAYFDVCCQSVNLKFELLKLL